MRRISKKETGDLLRAQGKLTEKQLELVRRRQQRLRVSQHRAIIDLNYASEEDTYRALSQLERYEFVDLSNRTIAKDMLAMVPVKLIFHYRMIPLRQDGEVLTIAFSEPPTQMEQGNLRLMLGKRLKIVLATPSCIHSVIKRQFGLGAESIQKLREERGSDDLGEDLVFDVNHGDDDSAVDATIAAFVDQILLEALRMHATDVHIEPYYSSVHLRYRIDGVLEDVPVPENLNKLHGSIVSRLKIMAGLNIAEKRLPHDGRISMKTAGEDYDLRVSIIPTKHGEAVCLRILGRRSLFLDLAQLGMEPHHEEIFSHLTKLPQGMILVTGPTGSGKTTSLYAGLVHANDSTRKTITIEDPIEYQLEGVTQIQVKPDIGMTFAAGLRSILRHDPDVVLIGEIRDHETAEIAVRAAQTGHLVYSTLHTNDSLSAITRLLEMKIDPFLIGSSVVASIAQRLARRICRHCAEPDDNISPRVRSEIAEVLKIPPEEVSAMRGRGCEECNQNGYRGRTALFEFFLMDDDVADLIGPDLKTGELRRVAREKGWRSLRESALTKVQAGVIPVDEVERVTRRVLSGMMLP